MLPARQRDLILIEESDAHTVTFFTHTRHILPRMYANVRTLLFCNVEIWLTNGRISYFIVRDLYFTLHTMFVSMIPMLYFN